MATVTGIARLNGSPVAGAKVTGINDTKQVVEATAMTEADGSYLLNMTTGDVVHILIEYEDGTQTYNDESKPFIALDDTLTVQSGQVYTIAGTGIESYTETNIESGGELVQESGSELNTTG